MRALFSTAGLANASARHPWQVIGLWLVLLVLAGVAATGLGDALVTDANFTNKPESVRGAELLEERMNGSTPISETVIVRSATATVDDPAFQSVVQQTSTNILALSDVIASAPNYYQAKAAGLPEAEGMVSADRHATIIPVTFSVDWAEANKHTEEYLDAVTQAESGEFQVLTVGNVSSNHEFNHISERDLQRAEQYALPLTAVILVVVFAALVAAGVPLVLAFASIFVAVGLTALVGRFMDLSFYVVNMIVMIGLAVGIDYALFIISRYREERRHGVAKIEAITTAGSTASKAVLFSGITVLFALSGMLLMPSTIFRSLGTGAVLTVFVAVFAMLTLVPAILSLLGDRIDWPRRRSYDAATVAAQRRYDQEVIHGGFWGTMTRIVMSHPVISVILAAGLLGAAAMPYFDLNRGTAGIESLPPSEVRSAYEILNRDFSAGVLAPVEIVVDGPKTPEVEAGIDRLLAQLGQDPAYLPNPRVEWNQAGDLALIEATLAADANSSLAYETLDELRGSVIPSAFHDTGAEVFVTGSTAFNADFFEVVDNATPLIFAWVLGLSFVLLLVAFRSLIVPFKAILMNLLSVGATYGLMVLVFQKGYGADLLGFQQTPIIEAWVPIFLFCVLFGLSMDYHVFLISRIREHYDLTHRNRESVAVGLQATARLITGAALIMVVVFAGFAAGDLVAFQQMGFGLAVAVFLDATVVRSVLVPATMALLGNLNWYLPTWLHWIPDLRIEGRPSVQPMPRADLAISSDD